MLGNGNCYYKIISLFLFGKETYYDLIRQYLYGLIANKKDEIITLSPVIDYFDKLYEKENHINFIKYNYFLDGDLEVDHSTKCFKINIEIYRYTVTIIEIIYINSNYFIKLMMIILQVILGLF